MQPRATIIQRGTTNQPVAETKSKREMPNFQYLEMAQHLNTSFMFFTPQNGGGFHCSMQNNAAMEIASLRHHLFYHFYFLVACVSDFCVALGRSFMQWQRFTFSFHCHNSISSFFLSTKQAFAHKFFLCGPPMARSPNLAAPSRQKSNLHHSTQRWVGNVGYISKACKGGL